MFILNTIWCFFVPERVFHLAVNDKNMIMEPASVRHPVIVSLSVCLRGCFLFQAGNPANEVKLVVCYLNEVF
jgi:hypothetical protein